MFEKNPKTQPKQAFDVVVSIPQEDAVASVTGCRSTSCHYGLYFFKL